MRESELSAIWIDGKPVEFTSGSGLNNNLRELNVESLKPLQFDRDKAYAVKVTLSRGVTYEGRMAAGLETMVARDDTRGTLYTREFTSRVELSPAN